MLFPSRLVCGVLRVVPQRLTTRVVTTAVNHLLRGQPMAERLGELSGRSFRLHIDDAPVALTFEITTAGLQASLADPHVTMRGALTDFVALALRREDPDTLFFQRRLVVEGETETGLHLKNLLDGWEYDWRGHVNATLPQPLASLTLGAASAARSLRALSRLRRPGSHRNSRPGERTGRA
jgi:predicted lipid carrier protein YhbT